MSINSIPLIAASDTAASDTAASDTEIPSSTVGQLQDGIRARLHELYELREQARTEATPPGMGGDAADRSTNVEAAILLESLEARILELELRLQAPTSSRARKSKKARNAVGVSSSVPIRFEDEDDTETLLVSPLGQTATGSTVITPGSPLGKALLGAEAGAKISYRTAHGSTHSVEVVSVDNTGAVEPSGLIPPA